jgi:peptidyl-prolyl cis-trans isomerase D
MFDSIRKHQRVLQGILLLLIFPAFAFFGISGYDRFLSDDGSEIAKVGDTKVTKQEFDQAQARQMDQIRRVLGDQADPKLLDTEQSRKEILDSLVTQKALGVEAARRNISVTDGQVREAINGIEGLKKPDGTFDMERYRNALAAQNKSQSLFEFEVRRDLALQVLPTSIAATSFTSKTALARMAGLLEEQREVRILKVKIEDFISKAQPNEEQLKKYYNDNLKKFEAPEQAKVEYLVLSKEAIAASITLNADDVKTYYEQNKTKYAKKEERKASHVLLLADKTAKPEVKAAAKAKAEDVLKRVKAGGDFAAIAKAESQDPGSGANGGDLGFFDREAMVKPFADAAWLLKEGEISGVVESDFGFHVIKLTGIKGGGTRSLEEAKVEIESEIKAQQASKKYTELAEGFTNGVYEQSDSYAQTAEKYKLKIQTAEGVTRTIGGKVQPGSPLANQKLLSTLFSADSISKKRNTEAIDVGAGNLVSARIVEYQAAKTKPLNEVEVEARSQYGAAEAQRLAMEAGKEKIKALQAAPSDAGFAPEKLLVSRSNPQGLPMNAVEAIFASSASKLPAFTGIDLGSQGYQVFEISRIATPKAEEVKAKEALYQSQFAQTTAQQSIADYLEALKARTSIKTQPEKIAPKKESN